jgi:hypothetical protein
MAGVEATIHPDLDWAASGAMALTGNASGSPLLAPAPVATAAREAIDALIAAVESSPALDARALRALDPPALLSEHAALLGHAGRRGTTSVGGTCHLLSTCDGWIAVNLARVDDAEMLPAWVGDDLAPTALDSLARRVADGHADVLVQRARELGMPVARVCLAPVDSRIPSEDSPTPWLVRTPHGTPRSLAVGERAPLIVDLSSLWAGPLCAHLLGLAGARVIKVESVTRPDGARRGVRAFYDLLNSGKASVALDFTTTDGRRKLAALLNRADIVVESARPRALRQLGIDAERWVAELPGRVWVSITGYGRAEPMAGWVAFGDDAAAAGGLVADAATNAGQAPSPVFCADAVADPLTGMHAAAAALDAWRSGCGGLLDVALARVAGYVASRRLDGPRALVHRIDDGTGANGFAVALAGKRVLVAPPRARTPAGAAAELGADTARVLEELGVSC